MGVWRWLFGRHETDPERAWGDTLRRAGMPEALVAAELTYRRARAEAFRASPPVSERPGEPARTELACASCGRRMLKLAMATGPLMLDATELRAGVGPAEECVECGRAWCGGCYPKRPRGCPCGIGQYAVRRGEGVVHHGSLRLIKVHYP